MIKTIKVKKQFDLPTLIAYVWENKLYPTCVKSAQGRFKFKFTPDGTMVLVSENIGAFGRSIGHIDTKYEIEVEEEVNNTTIFKSVVGVLNNDEIMLTNMHTTIEGIQDKYGSMKEIHAVIDGKLQLIWEAE